MLNGHQGGMRSSEVERSGAESEIDEVDMTKKEACYKCKRCLNWTIAKEKRTIHLEGKTYPKHYHSNVLNN